MSENELIRSNLSEQAAKNLETWLTGQKYAAYVPELKQLIANEQWQQLEDSFFQVIEFGTGGRRGATGVGSNRINTVTMGEPAQALCEYARRLDSAAPQKGIVIACDTRLSSPELSRFVAEVCAANGFTVYVFDGFRSTPELSFAVRYLGAAAGIVVSASHNPPSDNGFKAYDAFGGQLVTSEAKKLIDIAQAIQEIRTIDFDDAVSEGSISVLGSGVDEAYVAAVLSQSQANERDLHVVYSPLHGAGQTNVLPVLQKAGFTTISVVEAQMSPDGAFPTVKNHKPNPEERDANELAVDMLLAERADIAITNDPDADRYGIMVRQGDTVQYLNGNQSGALVADYLLSRLHEQGALTTSHYLAKTIVTTELLQAIGDKYGVPVYKDMLIGFKYIGELMQQKVGQENIVMGAEESFGVVVGDYVRDKDGAAGALILAEYAAALKRNRKTLYTRLLELYEEHGLYYEALSSTYFYGASGFAAIQSAMNRLREAPPLTIGESRVTAVLDYTTLKRFDVETGTYNPIACEPGNIIVLELDKDSRRRITVRPSGTEPKIKLYIQWYKDTNGAVAEDDIKNVESHLASLLSGLEKELLA